MDGLPAESVVNQPFCLSKDFYDPSLKKIGSVNPPMNRPSVVDLKAMGFEGAKRRTTGVCDKNQLNTRLHGAIYKTGQLYGQ